MLDTRFSDITWIISYKPQNNLIIKNNSNSIIQMKKERFGKTRNLSMEGASI